MVGASDSRTKKGPDGKKKFRFCMDFRALNSVTKFDSYPLSVFEEVTDSLSSSKYLMVLTATADFGRYP